MDFTPILTFLDKYGWAGFIIVIACVIAIYYIKYLTTKLNKDVNDGMEKIANKITDNINETNGALIKNVIDMQKEMLQYITSGKREQHLVSIDSRFNIGEELNNKVRDLGNKYHCNRASIIEFHNSKENLNGLAFVWYDMQYEWQKRNIDSINSICKNMQASNLIPVIEDLKKSDNNVVIWQKTDLDNLYDRSSVLYNHLVEKLQIQGIIYIGLHSNENRLIGLLALEYGNEIPLDIIDMYELIDEAGNISTLLKFSDK